MISDLPEHLSKVFHTHLDDDGKARVVSEVIKGATLASKKTRKVLQAALQRIDIHGFRDPIKAIRSSPQLVTRKIREALSNDLFLLFGVVYVWTDLHREMGTRLEAVSGAPWSNSIRDQATPMPDAIRDGRIEQAVEEFCAQHRKYDRRDVLLMAYWLALNAQVVIQAEGAPTAFFHGMPGIMADLSKSKWRQSEPDTTAEPPTTQAAPDPIETLGHAQPAVLDESLAPQQTSEPIAEPDPIITVESLRTRLEGFKTSWSSAQESMQSVDLSALETWSRQFSVDLAQLRRAVRSVEAALLKRRVELQQRIAGEIAPEDAIPYLSALEYISHDESGSPQLLLEEDAHLKRIEKDLERYQTDCIARLDQFATGCAALQAALERLAAAGEDTSALAQTLATLPAPNLNSRSDIDQTLQALAHLQRVTDAGYEALRCARRDETHVAIDTLINQLDQVNDAALQQSLFERLLQLQEALPAEVDFADLPHVRMALDVLQAEWAEATRDQDVPHWASEYLKQQDVETLNHLLLSLSRAGKSVEVLAILVAIAHGDPSMGKLRLSEPGVRALLDGMLRVAPPQAFAEIFVEVFGNSLFLNAVEFDSDSAKLGLLIPFIAVQLNRPRCLAAEDLYFLMQDDFATHIPAWMKVAESLIMERQPILIARAEPQLDELAEIVKELQQGFERDKNHRLVHIRAEGNPYIQRMEADLLLPKLEHLWNDLNRAGAGTHPWAEVVAAITNTDPNDLYERSCAEANITRAHQGYSRKRLVDRTQSLLDRMQRYIELKESTAYRSDPKAVERESLLEELRNALVTYGAGVVQELETIIQVEPRAADMPVHAQPGDADDLLRRLERFFLTDETMLSQYAPLVMTLVSTEFSLPDFVLPLSRSLAQERPMDTTYNLYVNGDALQQALAVAMRAGDSERARQAQERLNELSAQAQSQIAEIRRHAVPVAPEVDRQMGLGQWPLAFQSLERQLSMLREAAQARAAQVVEESRALRRDALNLRTRLEELTLPGTTIDVVYRALEAAEEVARKQQELRLEGATTILQAVAHLIDFNESNPSEIQQCLDLMLQTESGPVHQVAGEFSLLEVIEILHMRAYNRLGLPADNYTESGWDDRIQILDLWQAISGMPALEEKLTSADVEQIEAFAFLFAKITKLRAVESKTPERYCEFFGRERNKLPRLETHFNQPRAIPLRRPVVLLFVTDKTISKARLRRLQQTIDEGDWATRALVLLIVPCAPDPVREFIRQRYERAPFVILDESFLRDIVLSARQHSAVGKLRASFLRATGAHAAEVFQFNGQVDDDNSIFVGRDTIVSRLSTTPQCFAIFGGRRIGKTSVLHAIQRALQQRGVLTALVSFEGFIVSPVQRIVSAEGFHSEQAERQIARQILQSLHDNAKRIRPDLDLDDDCDDLNDFRLKMNRLLAQHPRLEVVVLIDEMDVYILGSGDAQPLVEVMRGIHTEKSQCRFIFAGFVDLYKQINGKGAYAGRRSPWSNFLDGNGTLMRELLSAQAQQIVREGFNETLGFSFQTPTIPRKIVEYTTGHPAFVQKFCAELHRHLTLRQTDLITTDAIQAVFDDESAGSFVDFIAETMELNLLPLQQLIVRAVAKIEKMTRFRLGDIQDVLESYHVRVRGGVARLADSIDELLTASVLKEEQSQWYTFSVPSYAEILRRLELVRIERFDKLIEEARARNDLE